MENYRWSNVCYLKTTAPQFSVGWGIKFSEVSRLRRTKSKALALHIQLGDKAPSAGARFYRMVKNRNVMI